VNAQIRNIKQRFFYAYCNNYHPVHMRARSSENWFPRTLQSRHSLLLSCSADSSTPTPTPSFFMQQNPRRPSFLCMFSTGPRNSKHTQGTYPHRDNNSAPCIISPSWHRQSGGGRVRGRKVIHQRLALHFSLTHEIDNVARDRRRTSHDFEPSAMEETQREWLSGV
jgi:hypothetical protein